MFGLWNRVNELADAEDTSTIRKLLAEAGIEAGMHVGTEPDEFTPLMTAEWVLGQWVSVIDSGELWMLNSAHNISLYQYEKVTGNA